MALLIAILLPSLSRAKEQARRIVCASNLHQILIGSFTYGADNSGQLPPSPFMDFGGQANYMRADVFNDFLAMYGLEKGMWICPNIPPGDLVRTNLDDFPDPNKSWYLKPDYSDGPYQTVMLGYNYSAGLGPGYQPVGATPEEIKSPKTLSDPPDWVLSSDYMEVWWDGAEQLTGNTVTMASGHVNHLEHPSGGIRGWMVDVVLAGSNVGLLGGSVSWRTWPELEPRMRSHPWYPMSTSFW